jgi:hypothetical protein
VFIRCEIFKVSGMLQLCVPVVLSSHQVKGQAIGPRSYVPLVLFYMVCQVFRRFGAVIFCKSPAKAFADDNGGVVEKWVLRFAQDDSV